MPHRRTYPARYPGRNTPAGRSRGHVIAKIRCRAAGWVPWKAAAIAVAVGLVLHEIAYHAFGGDQFPLQIFAEDTRVLVVSHGGLDALGVGILAVSVLLLIDAAEIASQR